MTSTTSGGIADDGSVREPGMGVDRPTPPAEEVAAEIAPIIDRLRMGIAGAIPHLAGELFDRYDVAPPTLQVIGMLRNAMPARPIALGDLAAVFVYEPDRLAQLEVAVGSSLLEQLDDHRVRLAPRGQALIEDLHRVTDAHVADLWSDQADVVADVSDIVARLSDSAAADPGPALKVLAPVYEPYGTSSAMLLAERLTVLRFHRFDAHVAAWRAAGMTAVEMRSGPPEGLRRTIEAETNRRAAAPYESLSRAERLMVCRRLSSLP